jgi:RHS repeat-associated protein
MTNTTSSETKEFTYAYDTHGSVSALVNQTGGSVHATYGYDPYGAPDQDLTKVDTDKHSPLNPYRYSAKRLDSGSDSYDMGARRFAADPGRFLEQDLFMGALSDLGLTLDPLTQNRYGLAGGNPISFIEWDGHYATFNGHGNATRDYPVGGAARAAARMWDGHAREGRSGWGWGAGGGDEESDEGGSVWTRIWGGVKIIGGFLEGVAGCGAAVASGGLAAVPGGALCAHGVDTAASGLRQLISGEPDKTLTQRGLEAVGAPEAVAGGVDAAISVFGGGVGAAGRAGGSSLVRGIGSASHTTRAGSALANAGRGAEEAVSAQLGLARNVGSGRVTVPGSGPGGFRVPDFNPTSTIATRGTVVEVKAHAYLTSSSQLRDLVGFARSQNVPLEIFTNARLPQSGQLAQWIERGQVIISPLP